MRLRLTLLALVAVDASHFIPRLVGDASVADPISSLANLGASGVLATILWIQLGKAEKRADAAETRAISTLERALPLLASATDKLADKYQETKEEERLNSVVARLETVLKGRAG